MVSAESPAPCDIVPHSMGGDLTWCRTHLRLGSECEAMPTSAAVCAACVKGDCDNCEGGDCACPEGADEPMTTAATPDAQWVLLERAEAEHYRKMFLEASRQQDRMFWLLCFAVVMALAWMAVALWALTG